MVEIFLAIVSVLLIIVVLLQPGNSSGLSGFIAGSEHTTGKSKARGIDAFLQRITIVLALLFMILAITSSYFLR